MTDNRVEIYDDYVLGTVDPNWLQERVKPKRHIALSPELCILCRACEDVCPWECIFMMSPDIVQGAENSELKTLSETAGAIFIIDDNECTRCGICVDRCPPGALFYSKIGEAAGKKKH
jgi:formate hydrogenlyase subunit 6/NADH:ubiquinone oxidoreductase subunit I